MKKMIILAGAVLLLLAAVLFVPLPMGSYDDGGTREYLALTYRLVDWNRLTDVDGDSPAVYQKLRIYGPADRDTPIDELWERETAAMHRRMIARVLTLTERSAVVEGVDDGARYIVPLEGLADIGAAEGSVVEIEYAGALLYTDPPTLAAVHSWSLSHDMRHMDYPGTWLEDTAAEPCTERLFDDIIITEIYADCFFARTVSPMPYRIKLNGRLGEEWCVGDQIVTTHENVFYDSSSSRIEADLLTVSPSDFELDPFLCYKPVIYLYPVRETTVSVGLRLRGQLTCSYPAYQKGWTVTASPDGTLTDARGQAYSYLYWEGMTDAQYTFDRGFCIPGSETAAFLEWALDALGLNRREANEFIVYWLPLMQENAYNLIAFQTDAYTDAASLEVSPAPDTVIRVFMAWQALDSPVAVPPQALTAPERTGFTLVEWGGTEVK